MMPTLCRHSFCGLNRRRLFRNERRFRTTIGNWLELISSCRLATLLAAPTPAATATEAA